MGTGSAIFNEQQTYGNGLVNMQGSLTFTNGSGAFNVSHGKGFSATRVGTAVYKITLSPGLNGSFKGVHAVDAQIGFPASQGSTWPAHPGFAQCSDLQSDGQSFFIYTYGPGTNAGPTQNDPNSGSLLCFNVVGTMTNLNP